MTDDNDSKESIDKERRKFLVAASCSLGGLGALCALAPLTSSLLPSAKTKADAAPVQVDLSRMEPGEQVVVMWRGKPVWIIKRTPAMLASLAQPTGSLRDPDSRTAQQPQYAQNPHRSLRPDYLVLIGICTHLGCTPKYKPTLGELGDEWSGGFFCPCHGSTFDLAGRVFKGVPAPINMEVPPHYFLNDTTLVIGEDKQGMQ